MNREKGSNLIILMMAATVLMNLCTARKLRRCRTDGELPKKNEEKYRAIISRAPVGICVADARTGRILEFNEKFASFTGRTAAELQDSDWMHLTLPDKLQEAIDQTTLMNAGKISGFNLEKRLTNPEDSDVWINLYVQRLLTAENDPPLLLCMIEDITEQKKAQDELRISESRLKITQSIANVGNWEVKIGSDHIWASEQALKIYGLSSEIQSLPMKAIQALVDERDKAMLDEAFRAFLEEDAPYDVEYRIFRANDRTPRILRSTAVLERDEDGSPVKAVGIIKDITEHKNTELALTESNIKLEATLQSTADGIEALDLDGNFFFYNEQFKKMWGLPDHITKESTFSYIYQHLSNPNESLTSVQDLLKLLEHEPFRELHLKDGRTFERYANPIVVGGAVEGYVLSYRDISERKKRENEILYLSYHDQLTGLYNRTFFEVECKRLDSARQLPISVIMGDINGLKLVNDAFGHKEGDKLLIEAAKILSANCRKEDILARTGGDEFCILLPRTSAEDARSICKRIYDDCAKYETRADKDVFYMSISLGCATKTEPDVPLDNVLAEAEEYMYKQKLLERESMRSSLLASIKATMFEKSHMTTARAERLVALAKRIGQAMNLTDVQIGELELLSTLHDLGKLSIDDRILDKDEPLTEEEWAVIRKHPEVGYRIALASPELAPIAEYILCHHERWDGKGYPQGLKKEEIPLLSRIVAVLDAYDAMTKGRPHRRVMSKIEAIGELAINAGTQFDPVVTRVFIEILRDFDG